MLHVTNRNLTVARTIVFQSISTNDDYDNAVANGVASTWCHVRWCMMYSVQCGVSRSIDMTTHLVLGL
jgi:hypothetical protein